MTGSCWKWPKVAGSVKKWPKRSEFQSNMLGQWTFVSLVFIQASSRIIYWKCLKFITQYQVHGPTCGASLSDFSNFTALEASPLPPWLTPKGKDDVERWSNIATYLEKTWRPWAVCIPPQATRILNKYIFEFIQFLAYFCTKVNMKRRVHANRVRMWSACIISSCCLHLIWYWIMLNG